MKRCAIFTWKLNRAPRGSSQAGPRAPIVPRCDHYRHASLDDGLLKREEEARR